MKKIHAGGYLTSDNHDKTKCGRQNDNDERINKKVYYETPIQNTLLRFYIQEANF